MAAIVYMHPQKVRLDPIARTINFKVRIGIDKVEGEWRHQKANCGPKQYNRLSNAYRDEILKKRASHILNMRSQWQ